jgi:hypothetical protein
MHRGMLRRILSFLQPLSIKGQKSTFERIQNRKRVESTIAALQPAGLSSGLLVLLGHLWTLWRIPHLR